ncbi:hypothetical protein ABW19_dt0210125 [Dactylella cylindrospora]|nr:hypothetical protein ABW19_dt0210125 [Dactylella cylindrospora]
MPKLAPVSERMVPSLSLHIGKIKSPLKKLWRITQSSIPIQVTFKREPARLCTLHIDVCQGSSKQQPHFPTRSTQDFRISYPTTPSIENPETSRMLAMDMHIITKVHWHPLSRFAWLIFYPVVPC